MIGEVQATCVLLAMESWDKNRISLACIFRHKETEVEGGCLLQYPQNLESEFPAHCLVMRQTWVGLVYLSPLADRGLHFH